VIAFSGRGAESTLNAMRFDRISYQRIGQSVCVTGYPKARRPE